MPYNRCVPLLLLLLHLFLLLVTTTNTSATPITTTTTTTTTLMLLKIYCPLFHGAVSTTILCPCPGCRTGRGRTTVFHDVVSIFRDQECGGIGQEGPRGSGVLLAQQPRFFGKVGKACIGNVIYCQLHIGITVRSTSSRLYSKLLFLCFLLSLFGRI